MGWIRSDYADPPSTHQHSKNISGNPSELVTVYDSTVPEGTGASVSIYPPTQKATALAVGLHKFVPEKVWVNGNRNLMNQFVDTREELDLSQLRKHLK